MLDRPYRVPTFAPSLAVDFERLAREGARRGRIRRSSGLIAVVVALAIAAPAAALPHLIHVPRPLPHATTTYGRLPIHVDVEPLPDVTR